MNSLEEYERLVKIGKEIHTLKGVAALLGWDQETYMPEGGSLARSEQLELIASLAHKADTSKRFSNQLQKLIDIESGKLKATDLSPEKKAALREWRKHYNEETKLPNSFVKSFAKLTSEAMHVWSVAKRTNSFQKFAPYLERIVAMNQKKAQLLGYKEHPYDALIDVHEPGMTKKQIDKLFGDLKSSLKTLLKKILTKKAPDTSFLKGEFSHDEQMKMGIYFLTQMGYDFKKGRLDISSHPFSTTIHPSDSRVTTRLDPKAFMSNISVVLHEGGHALYELGLPAEHFGSPLCEAVSLGVHESQSRFWETRIGQSRAFWEGYLPHLKKTFPQLSKVLLDKFYKAINLVEPSLIRVDADEVTYSFHVILRFEIECALLEGKLKVRDLPEAWNAKMQEYLALTPKTNSEGCLQDVHWSMGEIGYFPTYTLGNLYASHIFQGFEKAYPDYEKRLAKQDLAFIREWLRENIHRHGKRYSALDLIEKASGSIPFSSSAFISYLTLKYTSMEE